jgi:hypothetical protein
MTPGAARADGGFVASVDREGRGRPIKELDFFTQGKPVTMNDIFEFLIEHEFFTRDQLEVTLVYLQDGGRKPRSRSVIRVAEIVMEMKRAAE